MTVTVVPAKTGWKVVYASSSLARNQAVVGKRSLSPVRAWIKAAGAAGIHVSSVGALGKTADGATAISAAGLSGSETVRPTVFGTARKGAIRAYDTTVTRSIHGAQDSYRVIVDAATGKLLYRQNLVDNLANDPVWSAFSIAPPFNPLNAFPWNYPSTDTRETYCWTATAGCTNVVSDDPATTVYPLGVASKFQWDIPMDVLGTRAFRRARSATTSTRRCLERRRPVVQQPGQPAPDQPDPRLHGGELPVDEPVVHTACNPAPLLATGQAGAQANPNVEDWSAAAINLFVGHNRMHDYSYYLGWDEGHWNAQQFNNGINTVDPSPTPGGPTATPVGNDAILGQRAIKRGPPG